VRGDLPELLEALAETFLHPGAFPAAEFHEARAAAWVSPELAKALDHLLAAAPSEDLAVDYAGLFLVGRDGPTLHLELSAHRHGRLLAPEILAALEPLYARVALSPPTGTAPDHLGLLLALLAHYLRRLGLQEDPESVEASRHLIHEFLQPLTQGLRDSLSGTHALYAAAFDALDATLTLTHGLLG